MPAPCRWFGVLGHIKGPELIQASEIHISHSRETNKERPSSEKRLLSTLSKSKSEVLTNSKTKIWVFANHQGIEGCELYQLLGIAEIQYPNQKSWFLACINKTLVRNKTEFAIWVFAKHQGIEGLFWPMSTSECHRDHRTDSNFQRIVP